MEHFDYVVTLSLSFSRYPGAMHISCFFFFFQAEDGIRDLTVTGVQTCALPICRVSTWRPSCTRRNRSGDELAMTTSPQSRNAANGAGLRRRSRRYSSSGVPADRKSVV